MNKKWYIWLLLAALTFLNLNFFLSRWAEEPHRLFGKLIGETELASLAVGLGGLVLILVAFEAIRSRRFLGLLLLLASMAGLLAVMQSFGLYKIFWTLDVYYIGIGALIMLVCRLLRDTSPDDQALNLGSSFSLMVLASFNVFLLTAPWTTHVPSYVQDVVTDVPQLTVFYYGSIHSDLSPISIGLRWIINLFFARPSINATAISSMIYVALGLAMAGLAIEIVFGRWWGWALLFLAWTDRWLFSSAVSSAIIGQPILSTSYSLLLCAWALKRSPTSLSWKETKILAIVNAIGLFYSLYAYAAARMAWLVGSGIAALILILRRAVWFNADGARKVVVALLPSIALIFLIWLFIFGMNTERFSRQIFISPNLAHQVKDINSHTTKLISVHDPDMPIWWGTGRPVTGENASYYWKRSPKELYEKVQWLVAQVAMDPPIPFILVLLGGVGMAVCLASAVPLWRRFALCLIPLTVISFATFIVAQDSSAYRRALATNLLVIVGVVSLIAVSCRGRASKYFGIALCFVIALLRAPRELNALFTEDFWSPVCVNCQPHINIRELVNDPRFVEVAKQQMRYLIRGGGVAPLYGRCASLAFESNEFKKIAPNSSELALEGKSLAAAFAEFKPGEILLASCSQASANDPDLSGVCQGSPPFGESLAVIPNNREGRQRVWWSLVVKR